MLQRRGEKSVQNNWSALNSAGFIGFPATTKLDRKCAKMSAAFIKYIHVLELWVAKRSKSKTNS